MSLSAKGFIPSATPEDIKDTYWDPPIDNRKKWDDSALTFLVVHEYAAQLQMVHNSFSSGFPMVSNREFCQVRTWVKEGDSIILVGASVNCPEVKASPDNVRGTSFFALKVTPAEGGVDFQSVTSVNPMGSIPAMVVNAFKTKPASRILLWKKWFSK